MSGADEQFTQVVSDVLTSRGNEVVTAKARGSDISGIAGCTAETPDCFRDVATTIGVDAVVFGSVQTNADGKTTVTLTHVSSDAEVRTRAIELEATNTEDAVAELRPLVDDFIANRPVDGEGDGRDFVAPTVAQPEPSRGMDFGRVKAHAWVALGGGGAAMALGAIFYSLASSKQSEVDDAPTDTGDDIRRLMDLEASGKRYTTIGNVLMIAGSISAVVGGVLVIMQARARPAERATTIGMGPVSGGSGMALTLQGSF